MMSKRVGLPIEDMWNTPAGMLVVGRYKYPVQNTIYIITNIQ